jgi:hypothetical protein
MSAADDLPRMDRRKALQWMLSATATWPCVMQAVFAADVPIRPKVTGPIRAWSKSTSPAMSGR